MIPDKTISLIAKIVSNSASETEIEAFNNWLESSEDNQKLYTHIKILWDSLPDTNKRIEFDESDAKGKIISKIRQQHKKTVFNTKTR